MRIELFGSNGKRSLQLSHKTAFHNTTATTAANNTTLALSPTTLQEVIRLMPRRWYNMDELVYQLSQIHGIPSNTRAVSEAVASCELEVKGIGTEAEVRRHDDKECALHRKASFACAGKMRKRLEKENVSWDMLWDFIKAEYGVESRTQMSAFQWTALSAELNAAARDHGL